MCSTKVITHLNSTHVQSREGGYTKCENKVIEVGFRGGNMAFFFISVLYLRALPCCCSCRRVQYCLPKRKPNDKRPIGDATSILCSLNDYLSKPHNINSSKNRYILCSYRFYCLQKQMLKHVTLNFDIKQNVF